MILNSSLIIRKGCVNATFLINEEFRVQLREGFRVGFEKHYVIFLLTVTRF